jgi:hypothetical protein
MAMVLVVATAGVSAAAFTDKYLMAVAYSEADSIEQVINLGLIGTDFSFTDPPTTLGAFDFSGALPADTSSLNFAVFARDLSSVSLPSQKLWIGALTGDPAALNYNGGATAVAVKNKIGTFQLNAQQQQEYSTALSSSFFSLFDDAGAPGSYTGLIAAGLGTSNGPADFFMYANSLTGEVNATGAFISILDDGSVQLSPVPVPAAAWLLGSGLVAVIGIRRKNRS